MKLRSLPLLMLTAAIALAATSRAGAADESAASDPVGRLGHVYLGLNLDHYRLSVPAPLDPTGSGYTIQLNIPVVSWLDFGMEHFRARIDGPGSLDLGRHSTLMLATVHGMKWGEARPFITTGWGSIAQEYSGKVMDHTWLYRAGVEFAVARTLTLTPMLERLAPAGVINRETRYGLTLDWRFAKNWNASLGAHHASVSGATNYRRLSCGLSLVF